MAIRLIKTLYGFILKTFLPLFAMTFFIVLFIVLMQFLWRYIDDLVGKGLGFGVIAELFFYAGVSMVPMALPLAILLASLMTFGNLGEKFELTAMKASGISLIKVMSPLIILISFICVGAFFFQNDVLPKAQVKMWTLLFSMRQKSPELEIPEGVFYDQIPGYNLFVRQKDQETGMLYGMMIYDVSRGGENATILVSDSARLAMAPDMSHLYLKLMHGEQFENLRQQAMSDRNVPFRREDFHEKEILIPFDANFNRMDEQGMRNQYVGKNIEELQETIDSVSVRLDSIGNQYAGGIRRHGMPLVGPELPTIKRERKDTAGPLVAKAPLDIRKMLEEIPQERALDYIRSAKSFLRTRQAEMEMKSLVIEEEKKTIRRHGIEFYKKFTLSAACLLFFFIGAPLGAIIRKGGLGTPLVISILLFLFYYIIDNTGYKMARDGRVAVWVGMWLSSWVLAPLGVYVTWKAMNDSAVFEKDRWVAAWRKLVGTRPERHVDYKEVIIDEVGDEEAEAALDRLGEAARLLAAGIRPAASYKGYWNGAFPLPEMRRFCELTEETVSLLTNSRDQRILALLPKIPVMRTLRVYRPTRHPALGRTLAYLFPIGIPVWLYARRCYGNLRNELTLISRLAAGGNPTDPAPEEAVSPETDLLRPGEATQTVSPETNLLRPGEEDGLKDVNKD